MRASRWCWTLRCRIYGTVHDKSPAYFKRVIRKKGPDVLILHKPRSALYKDSWPNSKGFWQTPQENNAPPMLYLFPSRSLAVLKCELIPDAIRDKSDVQQRHKRESTEAFEELGETRETVEGALRLLHQLGFEPEPSDIIESTSFDGVCMELGRNFFFGREKCWWWTGWKKIR